MEKGHLAIQYISIQNIIMKYLLINFHVAKMNMSIVCVYTILFHSPFSSFYRQLLPLSAEVQMVDNAMKCAKRRLVHTASNGEYKYTHFVHTEIVVM